MRAEIVFSHGKYHAIDEPQRVLDHQRLQLAVVFAAPEPPLQERPADFDFVLRRIQIVVSRASNDSAGFAVNHCKGALRIDRPVKELLEDLPLVAIALWMLLPDQRIARSLEERVEVVGAKRTHDEQISLQCGLEIEVHEAPARVAADFDGCTILFVIL